MIGVSADKAASQKAFASKYTFNYPLLSDTDKTMAVAYGAKGLMGVSRISVLIDPTGTVARVYEKVSPATHARDVLADLKELTSG